jgi:hypothetical protein
MTGTELISKERSRQIVQEGYSSKSDDALVDGDLAIAAANYVCHDTAACVLDCDGEIVENPICGDFNNRERKPRLRQLVIAGALIAAEIDRLQRAEKRQAIKGIRPAEDE